MVDWVPSVEPDGRGLSPLYVQIATAVARDIGRGRLTAGERLPSSRSLAEQLGVHRNTVLAAYRELDTQGLISTDPARGTYVADDASPAPARSRARHDTRRFPPTLFAIMETSIESGS